MKKYSRLQAYAPRVKQALKELTGVKLYLTIDNDVYTVVFVEPLQWYQVHGLPSDINDIESYVNKHYTQGEPLNKIGLKLIH
jgi:hypothetical protein